MITIMLLLLKESHITHFTRNRLLDEAVEQHGL